MTCKNCRFEFCWMCLADYYNHTSCNKFVEEYVDFYLNLDSQIKILLLLLFY